MDDERRLLAPVRLSRAGAIKAGALATGGAIVGGMLADRIPGLAASAPSQEQDAEILNFALLAERLQAEFYAESLKRAKLKGELRKFATVVGGHEREHVAFLEKALGDKAQAAQRFDFGDATADADAFAKAAQEIEDLVTGAYNAGAMGLTNATLKAAAKIASVEARHAAWIRDIAGENPAPDAAEPETTPEKVTAAIERAGYLG